VRHLPRLLQIEAEWFFAEHMLAAVERCERLTSVIDRSRNDCHSIDIVARAQLAVVLVDVRNPVLLRERLRP
jgi:hypothetical protein